MQPSAHLAFYISRGILEGNLVRNTGGRFTRFPMQHILSGDDYRSLLRKIREQAQNWRRRFPADHWEISWVLDSTAASQYHHQVEHVNAEGFRLTETLQKRMLDQVVRQSQQVFAADTHLLPHYHLTPLVNGYPKSAPTGTKLRHYALDVTLYGAKASLLRELQHIGDTMQCYTQTYLSDLFLLRNKFAKQGRLTWLYLFGQECVDLVIENRGDLVAHQHYNWGNKNLKKTLARYTTIPYLESARWDVGMLEQHLPDYVHRVCKQTSAGQKFITDALELTRKYGTPTHLFVAAVEPALIEPLIAEITAGGWNHFPPQQHQLPISELLLDACA